MNKGIYFATWIGLIALSVMFGLATAVIVYGSVTIEDRFFMFEMTSSALLTMFAALGAVGFRDRYGPPSWSWEERRAWERRRKKKE